MAHDHLLEEHIVNLVQRHAITEQSELQELLQQRGYDIPQATLSRKLKKLKIAKIDGIYKIIKLHAPSLPTILNIQVSAFGIIVLHVHPGQASSLGYYFDQQYVSFSAEQPATGILGTIAGDDTLILIVRSQADLPEVLQQIQADFPYLEMPVPAQ